MSVGNYILIRGLKIGHHGDSTSRHHLVPRRHQVLGIVVVTYKLQYYARGSEIKSFLGV